MKTEHLLIIRFSAIGDVAMLVPVVASLAKQYPQLRITVLSKPFARYFFENLAPNVGFMAADIHKEYKGIRGLNALYRRLLAKHFTAIADMHDVLRTKYLRLRFHIDRYKISCINKHRKEKKHLVEKGYKNVGQLPSSFDNYTDVLERLGYHITLDFNSLFSPNSANLRLLSNVVGEKKSFQQWIGIAPFAAHSGKIYPIEKMEQVIIKIMNLHPSCRIFLFGGNGKEKKQLDEWQQKYPKCMNASAQLSNLREEMMLMSQLDLMISMDSANMHLAAISGTKVLSIWGATHPYAGFLGWNQSMDHVVQAELSCRPCSIYGKKICHRGDFACMNNITPDDIIKKMENILNQY